jgi:uncharacterized protein
MRTTDHRLTACTPGTERHVRSLHFGPANGVGKAYLQAALHADEPPGLLVAHRLREKLLALEAQGALNGEIVLVPMANPIGAAQRTLGHPLGRFWLPTGDNFNRHYADLSAVVWPMLEAEFAQGRRPSVTEVRAALRHAAANLIGMTELDSLRATLLGLAIDADWVFDLHCDNEAVMHLYAATPQAEPAQLIGRAIGSELTLLATDSGDDPFDEACSLVWARLNERLASVFTDAEPWPLACVAVTIELRGERDVRPDLAERDAQGLIDSLIHFGLITAPKPALLPAPRAACALNATLPLKAPRGGVLVHHATLGSDVRAGDLIAEIIDPMSGESSALTTPIDGFLFARESARIVHAGMRIAKIAGHTTVRSGKLLSD